MERPDVVITGVNGALGRALARRLAGRFTVMGTTRCASTVLDGVTRVIVADVGEIPWRDIIREGTTVYHLAAFVHRRPSSASDLSEMRRVNVLSTAGAARACRELGASLVFASSVAVLGRDESSRALPAEMLSISEYGRSKLEAERAIRGEGERGLRHAIVRFPLLYGPYGRGNMERMLRAIGAGRYLPLGDRATRKACLFMDDAAAALELSSAVAAPGIAEFVASPARAPTLGEIHDAAFAAMRRRAPPHIPRSVALIPAYAGDLALRMISRRPWFVQAISTLTGASEYDGSLLASVTGFRDRVSLEEGLRRTAEWIRSEATR